MWVGRSRSLACVWTSQLSGTKPSSGALGTVQRGRALASGCVCHCMLAPTPTVALCVRGQAEAVRVQLLVIESCPRRSLWPRRPEALLGLCRTLSIPKWPQISPPHAGVPSKVVLLHQVWADAGCARAGCAAGICSWPRRWGGHWCQLGRRGPWSPHFRRTCCGRQPSLSLIL